MSGYDAVPTKEKIDYDPVIKQPKGWGVRHTQTFILFLSLSVGYSMRAQLSVVMVAMTTAPPSIFNCSLHLDNRTFIRREVAPAGEVNETIANLYDKNKTDVDVVNYAEDCVEITNEPGEWSIYRTYSWNKATQETILWSFFVGYTGMMIPAGMLAQKFGGKMPIVVALLVNGVLSLMTPWMPVIGDWKAVSFSRLLQGAGQAVFFPSTHTLLAKWAPATERGRLSTWIYSGTQCGAVIGFQLSGLLSGSPTFGWPSTFWLFGVVSLVCGGLLLWKGAASPHEHPTISPEELAFITGTNDADVVPRKRKVPWKKILTSSAVWGLTAAHIGSAIGFLFALTQTPLYLSKVLGVDIKSNGLYSSLPYIAMYFMTILFGYLSDLCKSRNLLSVANIRKVATTIGLAVSGLVLIGFVYVKDTFFAVLLLIIAEGLHSGIFAGFGINQIDIAPNFAGSIMALGNMLANLAALAVPFLVANIVGDDSSNQGRWQMLFYIIVGIEIFASCLFNIFAKGEVQPWNYYDGEENSLNGLNQVNTEDDSADKCEKSCDSSKN